MMLSLAATGGESGRYVSPKGRKLAARTMPDSRGRKEHIYRVRKDIEGVLAARVVPWFGQRGLGVQYKLPTRLKSCCGPTK